MIPPQSNNSPKTAKGNVSSKKAPGQTWRRYLRTEQIARLELAHYSDAEIAFSQGITVVRVGQIKRTPEYIAIRMSITTGIVSEADKNLIEDEATKREVLRDMVPSALLALRDAILDHNNPALRLRAAQDLLDREGTLAKVSKTEVKAEHNYNFDQHDEIGNSLLNALQETENGRETKTSAERLEDMGITEFAKAGLDKTNQINLQKSLDLISAVMGVEIGETIN